MTDRLTYLKGEYEAHKANALHWKWKFRNCGGSFSYDWACAEFRLARRALKYLRDAA